MEFYTSLPKSELLAVPHNYAWNIAVRCHQFTQEELLDVREFLDLPTMIRCQRCLTLAFLKTHFAADIDACLEVDWNDVKNAGIQ